MLGALLTQTPPGEREQFRARFLQAVADTPKLSPEEYEQWRVDRYNETAGKPDERMVKAGKKDRWFEASDCPLCRNKGFVAGLNAYGEFTVYPCTCREKRKAVLSAARSGLGALSRMRVNDYQTPEKWQADLKNACVRYLKERPENWLVLLGQSGCGKTHLCASVVNQLVREGRQARYLKWLSFAREIERVRFDDGARRKLFDGYAGAEVLYIDDLLKDWDQKGKAELALAMELIDCRYNMEDSVTVISSEWTLKKLSGIDEALAGRVRQRAGKYLLQVDAAPGRNWRLRDADAQPAG